MTRLSTSGIISAYGPPCHSNRVTLTFHGGGRASVTNVAVDAFRSLNAVLVKHGYVTRRADTGGYNCRRVTGGSGWSPHAVAAAVDINWTTNPYGRKLVTDMPAAMVAEILAIRTNSGEQVFRWGGNYSTNKDAMHWEIICSRADLLTGIKPSTVPGAHDMNKPQPGRPLLVTRQQVRGTWRRGDQGEALKFTQAMLTICQRYHRGPVLDVDGLFGGRTEEAVRAMQKFGRDMGKLAGAKNLHAVDGIVGPATNGLIGFWVNAAFSG